MAEAEQVGDGLEETPASIVGLSPVNHHLPLDPEEVSMVASTYPKWDIEPTRSAKHKPFKTLPLTGLEEVGFIHT